MKWAVFLALILSGCRAAPERHYDYCAVTDVEKQPDAVGGHWIAHCSDGSFVVFSGMIKEGTGIFYTPYYENNDAVTRHGYIHYVESLP